MDRCALFVDAGYVLADGAMAVHGTRRRESVSWDYSGLLQLLAGLAAERSGLPLLRCYWYEATVEGRRGADHDALADLPGVKLRLAKMRPGRREGVESEIHRDLATLARNKAVSDAMIVSAEEDLAGVIADVQDLGMRVTMLHITVDGNWTISRALRQECDDIVEVSASHLRPYVDLISGAEPPMADEPEGAAIAVFRPGTNGHGGAGPNGGLEAVGVVSGGRFPSFSPAAPPSNGNGNGNGYQLPPSIYTEPVVAEYHRSAPQVSVRQRPEASPAAGKPAAASPPADQAEEPRDGQDPAAMYQAAAQQPGPIALPPAGPGQEAQQQTGPMEALNGGPVPVRQSGPFAAPPMHGFDAARHDGYPAPAAQAPREHSGPQDIPLRPEMYPAPIPVEALAPGQPRGVPAPQGYAVAPDFPGYAPLPAEPAATDAAHLDSAAPSSPLGSAELPYRGTGPGTMGLPGQAGQAAEAEPAPGPAAQVRRLPARSPAAAIPAAPLPSPAHLPQHAPSGQPLPQGAPPQAPPAHAAPPKGPPVAPPAYGQPLPLGPAATGGYAPSGSQPYGGPQPVPLPGQHPLAGQPGQLGLPGQPGQQPGHLGQPGGQQPLGGAAPGRPLESGEGLQPGPAAPSAGTGLAPVQAPSFTPGQAQQPQQAPSLADAVQSAHEEGQEFGGSVARDAPALWLEAVLARKPRMPSDLEARLLQGSSLPIDYLLHDEVRHALRRGFWDALERARR